MHCRAKCPGSAHPFKFLQVQGSISIKPFPPELFNGIDTSYGSFLPSSLYVALTISQSGSTISLRSK